MRMQKGLGIEQVSGVNIVGVEFELLHSNFTYELTLGGQFKKGGSSLKTHL